MFVVIELIKRIERYRMSMYQHLHNVFKVEKPHLDNDEDNICVCVVPK